MADRASMAALGSSSKPTLWPKIERDALPVPRPEKALTNSWSAASWSSTPLDRANEPPWGVEPQSYALRVGSTSTAPCTPSPSLHLKKNTVLILRRGTTPFEATKEATTEINTT